jgi:hypothetical protein
MKNNSAVWLNLGASSAAITWICILLFLVGGPIAQAVDRGFEPGSRSHLVFGLLGYLLPVTALLITPAMAIVSAYSAYRHLGILATRISGHRDQGKLKLRSGMPFLLKMAALSGAIIWICLLVAEGGHIFAARGQYGEPLPDNLFYGIAFLESILAQFLTPALVLFNFWSVRRYLIATENLN